MKILIADDHPIVRQGLKQIVSETPDIIVAAEASNAREVLSNVSDNDYDVIVLDITMPGANGLDLLRTLKSLKPSSKVLILSIHPEEQYAVRALKAGAYGYVTKETATEDLVSAIRKVSVGRKYISPPLAERLASKLEGGTTEPLHSRLSTREYEVMCMIASGNTIGEIAERLSLSKKTVSTYRTRVMTKMDMKKTAELISYAIRNRLAD